MSKSKKEGIEERNGEVQRGKVREGARSTIDMKMIGEGI